MLPATVLDEKRLNCWKTMPIFLRIGCILASDRAVTSCPKTRTVPEVGLSSSLISLTKVDLPAPE